MGFDIILNENLKPFVLEVNHGPSLNTDTELDYKIKHKLINSIFDLLDINLNRWNLEIKKSKKNRKLRILSGKRI